MENLFQELIQAKIKKILKRIRETEKRVKKNEDEEVIHNFRIAIRRLRSILETFNEQIRIETKYIKNLKKVFKITGKIRDYDIILRKIQEITKSNTNFPLDTKIYQEIESLKENLIFLRKKNYKNLLELVTSKQYKIFEKNFFYILNNIKFKNFYISYTNQISIEYLCLSKFYLLLSHNCWNHSQYDVLEIHHFRKEIKKTRYTLEFFNELYKSIVNFKILILELKELQNVTGLLVDLHLIQQELQKYSYSFIDKIVSLLQTNQKEVFEQFLDNKIQFFNKKDDFIKILSSYST